MREPSRKSAEYHRFRPDSGCLLYFELRMAATAISNDRDPKTSLPMLIKSNYPSKMRNMVKCYLDYDILHWRTTTDKGRLTL